VETPPSRVLAVKMEKSEPTSDGTPVKAPDLPQRFVALFFDDLQLSVADATYCRQAARKVLGSLSEGDRCALFTTSGQVEQDFTADRTKLDQAIQRIMPTLQDDTNDCAPPSLYLVNAIAELNDSIALAAAMKECGSESTTRAWARQIFLFGEYKVRREFASLGAVIRRMSELPGQRTIVMVSPGFFVPSTIHESGDIIDRATKANIVISAIDARGLYTPPNIDASTNKLLPPDLVEYLTAGYRVQNEVLGELADGTGGLFFHDRNDIDQGLVQAAAVPEVSYVLGFMPQNLKLDGKYHHLKVTLANKQKWALQARHGYFAPHGESDADATAKEEIQQAVFSQEELRELPMQCQTQFFRSNEGVHLSVVAHIETSGLRFRKAEDRNKNKLTVVTAVFDENGSLLAGLEKIIDMQIKDATLERVNKRGLSVKFSFDLQPGTFLVRVVVRDSEGAQMAALSRGVVIPRGL
jgi:VWFA-related protein